jgi:hypothetical protein
LWFGGELNSADGGGNTNVIDYVTIASAGNATDFGDLTAKTRRCSSASSSVTGLVFGGITTVRTNVIEYVTIASTGNAADFGDLSGEIASAGACSNVHGGL